MECYREGGCGPYEMLSCSECPASKREYLINRIRKQIEETWPDWKIDFANECLESIHCKKLRKGMQKKKQEGDAF